MSIEVECFHCGARFEGRPNSMYCSSACKDAEKYRRRRVREVQIRIEHAARQRAIAELNNDWLTRDLQLHREHHLQKEIESLSIKRCEKRGTNRGSNSV